MPAPIRCTWPLILAGSFAAAACAPRATPPQPTPAEVAVADTATASPHDMSDMDMDMSGHDMDMAGMSHTMPELPATAGPGFTVGDVRFMQHMIGHHAQAVVMSDWAPSHGASETVQKLAQKIRISQTDEIAFMKRWLEERDQAVPTDSMAHAMMMPGMLTPAELAQLDAARGVEFDRLFLKFMIGHHRGALGMLDELYDTPGAAQDSDLFRFVTDVYADQRAEINIMQQVLGTLR
jgi:uncharacterized protein (DUF305 family)